MPYFPSRRRTIVAALIFALGLCLGLGDAAWGAKFKKVDWSEFMEEKNAPPPTTAAQPEKAEKKAKKTAKKGKKGKKGKAKARKGKARNR
jgi:hypothetical protein